SPTRRPDRRSRHEHRRAGHPVLPRPGRIARGAARLQRAAVHRGPVHPPQRPQRRARFRDRGPRGGSMIAAIYARKSTEQNVSDDAKSVARQVEVARAFAIEHGWQVIEEYIDDAVSGRETAKLVNRARMLADATSGKFGVVVVRDYDRLSRDAREGPSFVYAVQDVGVEVWEYAHRAPIDVSTALKRTMLNMKAGFSAHEAEAASERTREEKYRRASRGTVADGRVLGYQNVGEHGSRRRTVCEPEAELVRRIFALAADGKGILRIAHTLNSEGVKN